MSQQIGIPDEYCGLTRQGTDVTFYDEEGDFHIFHGPVPESLNQGDLVIVSITQIDDSGSYHHRDILHVIDGGYADIF